MTSSMASGHHSQSVNSYGCSTTTALLRISHASCSTILDRRKKKTVYHLKQSILSQGLLRARQKTRAQVKNLRAWQLFSIFSFVARVNYLIILENVSLCQENEGTVKHSNKKLEDRSMNSSVTITEWLSLEETSECHPLQPLQRLVSDSRGATQSQLPKIMSFLLSPVMEVRQASNSPGQSTTSLNLHRLQVHHPE